MTELILATRQLTRRYKGHTVVNAIDIELHAGEILGLLGPNGAGKSTLLQLCAGVLAPTSGTIEVLGESPAFIPQARRHIGYLPDVPPLYPNLTVIQQLKFSAQLFQLPTSALRQNIKQLLSQLDLVEIANTLTHRLSKGMKQRLGLAQILLHQPKLIILDEPTSGLDPEQNQRLRETILNQKVPAAVLLSTHNLSDIQALCTDVMLMNGGKFVFSSKIADLEQSQHNLENIFLQHIHYGETHD